MQRCFRWLRGTREWRNCSRPTHVQGAFASKIRPFSQQHTHQGRADSTPRDVRSSGRPEHVIPDAALPAPDKRKDASAWLTTLEGILPGPLRAPGSVPSSLSSASTPLLSAADVARVLARARSSYGLDLLLYLAVEQGRWEAAVWLVTHLIDGLWTGNPFGKPTKPSSIFLGLRPLDQVTDEPAWPALLDVPPPNDLLPVQPARTLDYLTSKAHLFHPGNTARDGHELLGEIWQSLGNMILADSEQTSTIRPEILEIIALLHHKGIMPDSIYNYAPFDDGTALRQPPTLHLLSSHILTSLSDAVWRAHETSVVKEARTEEGKQKPMRPEIPGSMYRVRVGGLGHEVWLELVLWSCIQGGWTLHGAGILESVAKRSKGDHSWSVLSWREVVSPMVRSGQEKAIDWNEVRFLFNTGSSDTTPVQRLRVERTVSSEVVAVYVDALLNSFHLGVGDRGAPATHILEVLFTLKSLLKKNHLSLETTSWDAVLLRFFESQAIDLEQRPAFAQTVIELSSQYGAELPTDVSPARNEQWQPIPPYVLDGTAAPLGLFHRILRANIQAGNLTAAWKSFSKLQLMTDSNKMRSIKAFFRKAKQATATTESSDISFDSHYNGIDYPAFYPQLPISVLAPLLKLVTEARAFDLGSWLLRSSDIDGPVIPTTLHGDTYMIPVLFQFASATKDADLLAHVLGTLRHSGLLRAPRLSKAVFGALIGAQIEARNWAAIEKTLDSFDAELGQLVSPLTIAGLVRAMLRTSPATQGHRRASVEEDLNVLTNLYGRLVKVATAVPSSSQQGIDSVLVVTASINSRWAELCWQSRILSQTNVFKLDKVVFNVILEGVVDAYGSEIGQHLLCLFWSPAREALTKDIGAASTSNGHHDGDDPLMPLERPGKYLEKNPNSVRMELQMPKGDKVRVRGRFRPNVSTVRIIVRKVQEEQAQSRTADTVEGLPGRGGDAKVWLESPHAMIQWAVRVMRQLGVSDGDIVEELSGGFGQELGNSTEEGEEC